MCTPKLPSRGPAQHGLMQDPEEPRPAGAEALGRAGRSVATPVGWAPRALTSMKGRAILGAMVSVTEGSWERTTNSSALTGKPASSMGEYTSNSSWMVR